MKQNRRDFLKTSGLAAGTALLGGLSNNLFANKYINTMKSGKMKFRFRPYTLELKHVFTVAEASRSTTPIMLTEIEYEGVTGYGEASMPPYLGESHATATEFLSKVDLSRYSNPFDLDDILSDIDAIAPGNPAAKASVDIALHDLVGKLMNQPWFNIWGYDKNKTPNTTFTIGIDKPDVVRKKTQEAVSGSEGFKILKVKLGLDNDKEMIETIRSVTNVPLTVDANQGWKDKEKAIDMIHWLKEHNVVFVEQPMPKTMVDENAWVTEHSPLPTMGDEAVQRLVDVPKAHGVYSGINIKLMKSTGMREAQKMLILARSLGMKVMIGCMTETSCAVSAASQLSPKVDWADLDGNLLVSNDIYKGTTVVNGKVTLTDLPGVGITKI
ncbi:MAG TPA: enolase C-terminal domain-like protein [Ignavibacteriales bacterium]|nr:enolase C-terminal domain-like protein [Ignavibacteriales bacterium]